MDGNNLQEIEEKLDFFMATWEDGIRTIQYESGRYTRSRIKSHVDLIKLHSSQTNFIKKEMIQKEGEKEKYKIYGITQDVETMQYMIKEEINEKGIKEEEIKEEGINGIDEKEIKEEIKEKEIEEELDFFMAIWEDGIQTIEKESEGYKRSRITKSCVDLIKLHNSSNDIKKDLKIKEEFTDADNIIKKITLEPLPEQDKYRKNLK
ncbi:14016_t:CDS:2, partial [Racocetra persica]